MMTIQHITVVLTPAQYHAIENTTVYAYEGRDGSMAYDIEGGPDAMATAIRHIVPVWPVPFAADCTDECDVCQTHGPCQMVRSEVLCAACYGASTSRA